MLNVDVGFYIEPCQGEVVSGDAVLVHQEGDKVYIAIIDVLGHGRKAHDLTPKIIAFVKQAHFEMPGEGMSGLHDHIRGSRGAAVGIGILDLKKREFHHTGVGNTVTRKIADKEQRFISKDGIVGEIFFSPREQTVSVEKGDLFLFYSDGVKEHFKVNDYPTIRRDKADLVARNVVNKFGVSNDDSSCIAIKVL